MFRLFCSVLVLATCVAVAAGCGGSASSSSDGSTKAAWEISIENAPGPKVHIPDGRAPRKLVVKEVKPGTGKPAKKGDDITVEYVGLHWDGTSYANSWSYPEPPSFTLGTGRLPQGFEEGILGMKAGGKRELIVPSSIIFPPGRNNPTQYPGDAVVFIVDMLKVH